MLTVTEMTVLHASAVMEETRHWHLLCFPGRWEVDPKDDDTLVVGLPDLRLPELIHGISFGLWIPEQEYPMAGKIRQEP